MKRNTVKVGKPNRISTESSTSSSNASSAWQYSIMPEASISFENRIIEYTGATNSTYTNAYAYKCVRTSNIAGQPAQLSVVQTAGLPMGDFTVDVEVFKLRATATIPVTYKFNCVGKPRVIDVLKTVSGFEFMTMTRDTIFDNRRLGVYSWLGEDNQYYYTNTETPISETVYYEADVNDISTPSQTNSNWRTGAINERFTTGDGIWVALGTGDIISLSGIGIYCASRGVIGDEITVTYTPEVVENITFAWQRVDLQPQYVLDLTTVSGYDATTSQTLKHTAVGTVQWM